MTLEQDTLRDPTPGGIQLLVIRAANLLGKPLGINPFPRAFANDETAGLKKRSVVFDRIYKSNSWSSAESRSGPGSEGHVGHAYARRLCDLLSCLGASRLFDAPCGDLNWMIDLARDPAFNYAGGDISSALIADLKGQHPNLALQRFDICVDRFPDADVWHCRDCLFHLPFSDIRKALQNFVRSSIPYALLTTHWARVHRNLDVPVGGFRYLDLGRPPISLPPADRYLRDFRPGLDFPRYVGLWRREAIAETLSKWRSGR